MVRKHSPPEIRSEGPFGQFRRFQTQIWAFLKNLAFEESSSHSTTLSAKHSSIYLLSSSCQLEDKTMNFERFWCRTMRFQTLFKRSLWGNHRVFFPKKNMVRKHSPFEGFSFWGRTEFQDFFKSHCRSNCAVESLQFLETPRLRKAPCMAFRPLKRWKESAWAPSPPTEEEGGAASYVRHEQPPF